MQDLPRRRRGGPSWTDAVAQRLTPTIKAFVVATALLYFFYVFVRPARPFMVAHLALGPGLFSGEIWQPVTSLFFHVDPLSFIFNLIGLWFVGATIERTQGTRRFIALFSTAGVLSNLAIAGVSQLSQRPVVSTGCSYAVLALFVAFGRIFGATQTQVFGGLYLRARTLAIIFVVWAAVMNLAQGDWAGLAGTVVTTAVGYFVGAPGGLKEAWAVLKARRHRRRYRVIEGGGGRPRKKYMN